MSGKKLNRNTAQGLTLIELMVAVGVLGVISLIAFPLYQDYIATARIGVMNDNIQSIRLLQEERKLQQGEYVEGTYDPDDPDASGGLKAVLGWDPRTETDVITYVVVCATDGTSPECSRTSSVTVTATHRDGGDSVSLTF